METETNLLDLTVRELLDEYGLMYSPECDYKYGVIEYNDAERLYKEYDLDDCPSVCVEELIDPELVDLTPLTYEELECLMENLGVNKRNGCTG